MQSSAELSVETVADGDIAASPEPPPSARPLFGVALFTVGVLFLATMDATTKALLSHFEAPLIVSFRYVGNLLLMLAVLGPTQGRGLVRTQRTGLVLLRAACLSCASLFLALAFARMPMAETTAVVFLAPTLVMLLARFVLAEEVGALGWLAAVMGFAGVMLIARPGGTMDPVGVVCALGAAVVTGTYQLLSRLLATSERTIALLFYTALVGSTLFGLAAPWFWFERAPTSFELLLLSTLGVYATIGHFLFTAAHRYAPASLLAPVGYVQLVFAGLLGWLVFHHVPDAPSLAGMAVIIASGVITLVRTRMATLKK